MRLLTRPCQPPSSPCNLPKNNGRHSVIDTKAMPFLADIPRHQATLYGGATAMWFEGRETSFAEFDQRTNQVANGLIAAGVKP